MLFLGNDLHERASQKVKISRDDILISRALSIICPMLQHCIRVTLKMHLFPADYKRVISYISYCAGKMTLHNVAFEY